MKILDVKIAFVFYTPPPTDSREVSSMKKLIAVLLLFQILYLQAEESEVAIDTSEVKAELPNLDPSYQEIKNSLYSAPSFSTPLRKQKEPSNIRFFAQSQLGTIRYRADLLAVDGKQYKFKDHDSGSFLDSLKPDASKSDKEYGSGYFYQQNLGFSFGKEIQFSLILGYSQGYSELKLKNKRATCGDRQIRANVTEKNERKTFTTTFFWDIVTDFPRSWLSINPYVGLGVGIAQIQTEWNGYLDESKKKSLLSPILRIPSFNANPFSTPRYYEEQEVITRYLVNNGTTQVKVPLIFDVGISLASNPFWVPTFSLDLGFRLFEITSTRIESSYYTGLKLSF